MCNSKNSGYFHVRLIKAGKSEGPGSPWAASFSFETMQTIVELSPSGIETWTCFTTDGHYILWPISHTYPNFKHRISMLQNVSGTTYPTHAQLLYGSAD